MNIKIIAFSIGLISLTMSCRKKQPAQNPANAPVPVNVSEVKRDSVIFYDDYPATVVALKEVELRSQVAGHVTGFFFTEGQSVRKGQKLYEIDRSVYLASYQQAKANVMIAQDNLAKARRDADRYTELNKHEAIARQLLDNALTDLQNAKSQLSSAKAGLTKAESDLSYSMINAPFNGTIGISNVRMGSLVAPNQTLLNVISSDDPMGVDSEIDQKELPYLRQLEKKTASKTDSTFRLILPGNNRYPATGEISIIDRAVNPQTGTLTVRLIFPNPRNILKPGMSCNVEILNENTGSQVVVPYRAVVEQMGEYFIYLAKGDTAIQKKVLLGPTVGPNVVVRSGLNAGEKIVTDGVQKLHDKALLQTGAPNQQQNDATKPPQSSKQP